MADENENEVVETAGSLRAGEEDEDDEFGEDGLVDAAAAMDVEGGGEDGDGGVVIIGDITGTTAEGEGAEAEASRKRKRASTSGSSTSIMGAGLLDVTRDQLAALINAHQWPGTGTGADADNWKHAKVPTRNNRRSVMWDYGRVYVKEGTEERRFFCQITKACREGDGVVGPTCIAFTGTTNSNAMNHLAIHGISSKKTIAVVANEAAAAAAKKRRNDDLAGATDIDSDFPVQSLHHSAVREPVVDMFAATKERVKAEVAAAGAEGVPSITLMIDIWEDKKSNRKFLGVRVRWVDAMIVTRQHLLGLRHLNPTPELYDSVEQYSELVYSWVVAVLSDFDLSVEDDIYAIVSDGGSDVKCCATHTKFLNKPWE